MRRKPGRSKKTAAAKIPKRAVITDAIRARIKKLLQAGKSGAAIAKAVGISLPSVQNIKKAFGLVKARKVKVKKTAVEKPPVKKRAPKKAVRPKSAPAAAPVTPVAEAPKSE